jgi:TatD DNase family protein
VAYRRAHAHLPARRAGDAGLSRPRAPERLEGLVDSHAHLQHEQFDADRDAVVGRARDAGIERMLVPGWDVPSSALALELADRYPDVLRAAVGVHPHHAADMTEGAWAELEDLAADARCVAVGEIGLDYFRNFSPRDAQHDAFDRQLALARRLDRPVLVHDREAHADVTARLLAWTRRPGTPARGVLHAFSGDAAMAATLTAAGFVLSFALPVAFRSAVGPRAAAAAVPRDGYLVETDAPYLGPDREARNEPTTVLRVVAELARLRESTPDDVAAPLRGTFAALVR